MISPTVAFLALVWSLAGPPGPAPSTSTTTSHDGIDSEAVDVTLDELLGRARQVAPDNLRADARISLGAAAVIGARPWLPDNPVVYVGVGSRMNRSGANLEVQAQISQRLEVAGERGLRRLAASARKDALTRDAQAVNWEVEVSVRAAFARAIIARELLVALAQIEDFQRRTTQIVRTRVAAGDSAELQLRVAEGELALATQARVAAEIGYALACRELATAAGWAETAAIEPRGGLAKLGALPDTETLLGGLDDHPRIAALDADVDAAAAQLAAERREVWPEPSVGVYAASEREPGSPVASRVVLATIEVPLPLFRRNQVDRARAEAEQRIARTTRDTRRYELTQEVQRWRTAADGAAVRVRSYADEVLPRFAENLSQLARAFEIGEIGGLEVVLARQRFADMQREALAAWSDYIDAIEGLERVTGRTLAPAVTSP